MINIRGSNFRQGQPRPDALLGILRQQHPQRAHAARHSARFTVSDRSQTLNGPAVHPRRPDLCDSAQDSVHVRLRERSEGLRAYVA